jgi:hypothetical protein
MPQAAQACDDTPHWRIKRIPDAFARAYRRRVAAGTSAPPQSI